ncbi:Com family DNA-binding transcriptional regulator [Fertoebacter nigrum]|uniref:Com family DNA-binding transcriptional regulator n=2 Tax=Fertoeibacter niger TaxID=2656921 RepID=A0A8X8H018_9RHOB|nr:Com family DNA-binding transcriptional regulator [Fertoeibacter niger]
MTPASRDVEMRCSGCARLLFKMEPQALRGRVSVKCPRCRAFNHLRPQTSPPPERASAVEERACGSSFPPKT